MNNPEGITYRTALAGVDWQQMKAVLLKDDFDNGRTPEQLRESFENSLVAVVAYDGDRIIGTARALSDGVCNAYIVDVWTLTPYRNRGIARAMMETLESRLKGQHIFLFTDDMQDFYRKIGYTERGTGMEKVSGTWLHNE